MAMRVLRAGVGVLLCASGVLMYAASWQRWGGACPWGGLDRQLCNSRQDHLYDFVAPTTPWKPVGEAAQLAGSSLVVLALAFVLLPWALNGRRPDLVSLVAAACAVMALVAVGVATVRSGLAGSVVHPAWAEVALPVWLLGPPMLLVRFSITARGWPRAAAIVLFLATPLVAELSYAIGPYDAQPWWEAISGTLTVVAGLCLLVAAAFTSWARVLTRAVPLSLRASASGAASDS